MSKILALCGLAFLLSLTIPVYASYNQIVPNTTLTAQTSNNTATADSFPGCEVTTVTQGQCVNNGDLIASNISKVNVHTLLSESQQGAKIYTTYIPYWVHGTHPNIGYSSQDPHQVTKEITDLTSRGFDGVLVDWYGPGSYEEGATEVLKPQLEQENTLKFALMIDEGAVKWFSCYPSCSATQALLDIISYARQKGYFSSPAAIKNSDGKTIVLQFGMEAYNINWSTIESQNTDLDWIFENASAFTDQYTVGAYGWLSPKNPLQQGYEGLDFTQYFLQIADQHESKKNWASTWKGFDDVVASWAPPGGRHIQQLCGKTWMDSWGAVRAYTGRLDAVQVVTWHDYEEGSEIQTGIDNCLSISASVTGSTLSWSVPNDYTLDHYEVYISADGQNLMSLGEYYLGTNSLNLAPFNLAPGTYQMFVQAVGAPSIKNQMSAAATYTIAGQVPTVNITALSISGGSGSVNPGQTAGPYTVSANTTNFVGTVSFTCSGLPAGTACLFNPASINLNGVSASTQLSITTTGSSIALAPAKAPPGRLPLQFALWFQFVGIVSLCGGRSKRSGRNMISYSLMLVALMGTLGLISCGGGTDSNLANQTPAGTYQVVVTGSSGSVQQTTTIALTVN